MTLAETKEPVKTGKRKVQEWEEEPEVTEWRMRMEERGGEDVDVRGGEVAGAVGPAGRKF